ncbi:LamG-like jellyroll fold domain-containing protein [Streptosporangium roseum]|uniref:LamG-like jellyroll fold domain-containing protein n=1 Tax=Streptosporangium roseum TaxID=2001 RepID=UPI00332F2EEC
MTAFPRPEDPDAPLRAALAEAKKQGQPVAVDEVFTETSRTWAHPEGHLTMQSYAGPAQLKQSDGSWAWIDTTLVEQDGVLKPKLAKANVELSLGGNKPFASMNGDKGEQFALSWLKDLPRPEVAGNVATYRDAAGKGADLVVTVLPTGFRHDVVLRERPTGPVEFRIPVQTDGLTFAENKKGGLQLTDAKGRQVASAAEPVATDAGPSPAEANTRQAVTTRSGKIDTRVVKDQGRQVLVLKPDPAFLNDPATRYPVTVDPTTTLTLQSDLVVDNTGAEDTSAASQKLVTKAARIHSDGHLSYSHSLLKFDTGPLAGRSVGSARLDMYADQLVGCRWMGPGGVEAKRVTSAWPVSGVGWSSQPSVTSFGSSIQLCPSTSSIDDNGNWIPHRFIWDITAMAQSWASGYPNHGIRLSAKGTSDPAQNTSWSVYFHSAERTGGTPPKLTVSYFLPPEIPTVTAESIDSMNGNDAIARSQSVKVGFKSSVPESTNLDYTVTVNDSTMAPPPVFPTGHVAHWKFDEAAGAAAAADSGPNGHTATYTGSRRTIVPGKLGNAVQLNDMTGSNGCCVPDSYASTSKAVLNQNSSFSLSTWVRLTDSEAVQHVASQDGSPFGMSIYYLGDSHQKWRLQISGTGGTTGYGVWVDSAKLSKVDTWTHLVAMYDASAAKIRLYVDGVLSGEADYQPSGSVTGGPFRIGGHKSGLNFLQGAVDDMRLYQRVLTLKEIKDLYGEVAATSYNAKPSGQVIEQTFQLHNPASLKFVVRACRSGIAQPSCNESPAYRITSDAPFVPTDAETGMADPTRPILSGMVSRPSGGPVTVKYYLYDSNGAPVGSAPLGTRTVNGGERASYEIPENTVQPGSTYTWQMQACALEVCTAKTAPVSLTTPGTPPEPPAEDVRHLTLGKDNFVIKTTKPGPTACDGGPCPLTDSATLQFGGAGLDKTVTVLGLKLDELPDGAGVSEGILKLGTPTCPAGECPADTVITAVPLKSSVTGDTKGSELAGDVDGSASYAFLIATPQADIAGSEYQWLMLSSNKDEIVTFGEAGAAEQPSITLKYLPAGPPSKVLNLIASPGDSGAIASWGLPESNGSLAMLDGYDVEVSEGDTVVRTLEGTNPTAAISGLTNGTTYTIKVRAKTAFGVSEWELTTVTPKAAPPPPPTPTSQPCNPNLDGFPQTVGAQSTSSAVQDYADRIKSYYQAQDAVLEGRVATIWEAPGVTPQAPSTAKLSLLNTVLVEEKKALDAAGITRTNSTVTVENVVPREVASGTVHVTATIKRTWDETATAAAAQSASAKDTAATRGEVEPNAPFIDVVVFDRCGNITMIQVPLDVEESSTDFIETDGEAFLAGALNSADGEAVASTKSGSTCLNSKYWPYNSNPDKWRPRQGLLFEVVGRSAWRKCVPREDDTTWNVNKFGAVATLYTDPAFRKKAKVRDSKEKYVLDNSSVNIKSTACFVVVGSSYQFGVQGAIVVGVPFAGVELGGTATVTRSAAKDCSGEVALQGKEGGSNDKIAFRSALWSHTDSAVATCWQSGGNSCSIQQFQQQTTGTFVWGVQKGYTSAKNRFVRSLWRYYNG